MALSEESESPSEALPKYTAILTGLESEPRIHAEILERLVTFRNQDEPPANRPLLVRQVERDRRKLVELMRAKGFFDAEVAAGIEEADAPPEARFVVTPHERYQLAPPELELD
ncbi:MAG: hypothetical protein HQM01_13260, partial [Magnetococcales bacterium]|nr:hypothetical protein [Magnetococcales bacterium]